MSFPRNVGQLPLYYNYKSTGRPNEPAPGEVFWSHYMDESNSPLYPFGHGLSYSKFVYSDLVINANDADKNITVTFNLKNESKIKGKEVAQLYIQDLFASVTRPVKELKGFELVELDAGEQKTIEIKLTKDELGFYDNQGNFIVEPGEFKVFVGGSSHTVLEDKFDLQWDISQ